MKSKSVGQQMADIEQMLNSAFGRSGMNPLDAVYLCVCHEIKRANTHLPQGQRYRIYIAIEQGCRLGLVTYDHQGAFETLEEWPLTDEACLDGPRNRYTVNRLSGDPPPLRIDFSPALPGYFQAEPRHCCTICKADNLEHFFTSKRSQRILCSTCFDARQAKQLAKEVVA